MRWRLTIGVVVLAGCSFRGSGGTPADGGPDAALDGAVDAGPARGNRVSCEPLAPITTAEHMVTNVAELEAAIGSLQPGDTIALEPGTYVLNNRLDLDVDGVTLRSTTGVASDVEIRGPGAAELFNLIRVRGGGVTIAALTASNAERIFHVETVDGVTKQDVRLFDLDIKDFTVSGVEVVDSPDGTSSDDGLLACSRIRSALASACSTFIVAVDFRGSIDGWRVTENTVGPICQNTVSPTHNGVRIFGRSRFAIVDHNRVSSFRSGIAIGNTALQGAPACNGQDGDGWDTYQSLVCANTVVYEDSAGSSAVAGIHFTNGCVGLASYNTIANTAGPTFGLRLDGVGSLVDHANNITTTQVGGSQPTPPMNGPDLDRVGVSNFVSYPDDLRLLDDQPGAIDLSSNPLVEEFCSWDLDGVERDPENPGFGAFAPSGS